MSRLNERKRTFPFSLIMSASPSCYVRLREATWGSAGKLTFLLFWGCFCFEWVQALATGAQDSEIYTNKVKQYFSKNTIVHTRNVLHVCSLNKPQRMMLEKAAIPSVDTWSAVLEVCRKKKFIKTQWSKIILQRKTVETYQDQKYTRFSETWRFILSVLRQHKPSGTTRSKFPCRYHRWHPLLKGQWLLLRCSNISQGVSEGCTEV